ncbi:MAG: stage II sporulation protein P [Firmicutes bacterium]|nr:stage II sporulation protein P [Bacillota bacterium]
MRLRHRRRLLCKTMVVFLSLFCLGLGAVFGYYYDSTRTASIPFSVALRIMLYGGDLNSSPEVASALPEYSEEESENNGTLEDWEVTYYHDDATDTDVPVFYGEMSEKDGDAEAMGSALIRVDEEAVPTGTADPPKTSVLIYCTHTSESYDGEADEEGRGEVLDVAHHLADTLMETYGIGAVVSDTVHDSPDWYQSYSNSKNTALELMEKYPDAELIIDLHRDAGVSKENSTTHVKGNAAATLLLVVGSNVNLKHPHWEDNWATAKSLGACIDDAEPSLLRGIRVQKGRYNQHLSTNCVLLEVGTDLNTLEEAEHSSEIVAEAISEYLKK